MEVSERTPHKVLHQSGACHQKSCTSGIHLEKTEGNVRQKIDISLLILKNSGMLWKYMFQRCFLELYQIKATL